MVFLLVFPYPFSVSPDLNRQRVVHFVGKQLLKGTVAPGLMSSRWIRDMYTIPNLLFFGRQEVRRFPENGVRGQ
eukprot:466958-Prorocentrum_lima.AAC.1